jgi:cell division protein FtsB
MNVWSGIIKFLWVALAVLSAVCAILLFAPRCRALRELQRKKAALELENRKTEAAVMDLRTRQSQFVSDPAFVERTAREIGMVKSNESVFRISKEVPRAAVSNFR